MSYQPYQLVRIEHELRLRPRRHRPNPIGWERPTLRRPRVRVPQRPARPILSTHEYLQLEFTVDERR